MAGAIPDQRDMRLNTRRSPGVPSGPGVRPLRRRVSRAQVAVHTIGPCASACNRASLPPWQKAADARVKDSPVVAHLKVASLAKVCYIVSGWAGQVGDSNKPQVEQNMELGVFSISLAVKDIRASQTFYEKLGFQVFGGDIAHNWLILKNGNHVIGLFQGMFERNILTFNPGWDSDARELATYTDVRELQRQLKAQGMTFVSEADENSTGPASFMVVDPDGNPVLVDQHV